MTSGARRALQWAPRILAVALGAFFSIFALDVFGHGGSVGETALALLLHLLPSLLVLMVLALAWRRPVVGAAAFAALALAYLAWAWGRLRPASYLPIAAPLLVLAGLYLTDAVVRDPSRRP